MTKKLLKCRKTGEERTSKYFRSSIDCTPFIFLQIAQKNKMLKIVKKLQNFLICYEFVQITNYKNIKGIRYQRCLENWFFPP